MSTTSLQPYVINFVSDDNAANNQIFVKELYRNVLDRSADQSGLSYWTSALNNHNLTRAELVKDFFDSPELQAKFQSSPEAAASIFHSLLNRDTKSSELKDLSNLISNGKSSVGDIAKEFLTSPEFLKLQNTSTTLPTVNVLWEDTPSWDSITANQLAKLIAYSPDGGVTHPNANLEFVVSGYGPNSTTPNAAPSHVPSPGETLLNIVYPNTADGLAQFIKSISDQVSTLSNGQVKWGVAGGTGAIAYHPDMNTKEAADWAGWTPNSGTKETSPDNTFIDYSLYLSQYLSSHGLQNFSQVVFEYQNSQDATNSVLFGGGGVQNGNLFKYKGDPGLLKQLGASSWHDVFDATATGGPGGNNANWSMQSGGFASDKYLAQAYDLPNGDYDPTWSLSNAIAPNTTTPDQAAKAFSQFFAQYPFGNLSQTAAVNNIRYLWNSPGSFKGTSYNPDATIVFAYGKEDGHDPQFQNTTYAGNNPAVASTNDGYRWSANDFAAFLSGDTNTNGFKSLLNQNIIKIVPEFSTVESISVGVWGGERALDAWIGF